MHRKDSDFADRKPVVFGDWLDQGDVLYVPRFIQQSNTGPEKHYYHVTISACRNFEQASSEFINC
uniref:Uncharacterized protein n=1 Tax=Meloidogyne hapla TaxID=6305 RepID=A0A1I8BMV7_MELHA